MHEHTEQSITNSQVPFCLPSSHSKFVCKNKLTAHVFPLARGDGVAQWVERRTRDPRTRGSNPVMGAEGKIVRVFSESKNVVLTSCRCVNATPVFIRMHENDHVRTLKIR